MRESQGFFLGVANDQKSSHLTVIETNRIGFHGMDWYISGWWFQPIRKIFVKVGNLPQLGVKIEKYLKAPPIFTDRNEWLIF